jgi:SAM-dependent methyltransferase
MCPVCGSGAVLLDAVLGLYDCTRCAHTFTLLPEEKKEDYGDDYFIKKHKNWFGNADTGLYRLVYSRIAPFLKKGNASLLDAGCGKGDFLRYVEARDPDADLYGIDLTDNADPRIHFIQGDFFQEDIRKKFDIVCSLLVIEHVEEPHRFMEKMKDALMPGGVLAIMTNNNGGLIYSIARALNAIGFKSAYKRLYSSHHVQHYTTGSLRRLVELHGFEVLLQRTHNYALKAVDVPESGVVLRHAYKLAVAVIFALSMPLRAHMLQTIVCRKKNV